MLNVSSLKEKIKLLSRNRRRRLEAEPLRPSWEQFRYARRIVRRQASLFYGSLAALFLQGLLEIALVLVGHRYLRSSLSITETISAGRLFVLFSIIAALYLGISYLAVKGERLLIVRVINDLRSDWFKIFLSKRFENNRQEDRGSFLAKITYHLPLLSSGLSNSLGGGVRWLLFVMIFILLSFIFGYKFLVFAVVGIIISFLVTLVVYFVSRRYISREATLYSKILRLIDFTLADWKFVKYFHRERPIFREFNELVELDSYFRVRRDLWMRLSVSLILVLLAFLGFVSGVFNGRVEYFLDVASLDTRLMTVVILMYFSRLLYEGLRVGLYFVPLMLGLKLSIPLTAPRRLGQGHLFEADRIVFNSAKNRLFRGEKKYRCFNFEFERGGRYLISGGLRSGRSALAKILSGNGLYGRRAWIIKTGKERFFYSEFFGKYGGFYYIDPFFSSSRSLLEVVSGKNKEDLTEVDLAVASNLIQDHPELNGIFFEKTDWRYPVNKLGNNTINIFITQVVSCILKRPYLIVVDNFWLDRADPEIEKLLRIMGKLLPESIMVIFSSSDCQLFDYQNRYEI